VPGRPAACTYGTERHESDRGGQPDCVPRRPPGGRRASTPLLSSRWKTTSCRILRGIGVAGLMNAFRVERGTCHRIGPGSPARIEGAQKRSNLPTTHPASRCSSTDEVINNQPAVPLYAERRRVLEGPGAEAAGDRLTGSAPWTRRPSRLRQPPTCPRKSGTWPRLVSKVQEFVNLLADLSA